ncbi:MAG: Uncharacterized protein G01um101425_726 [Candidatus Peregrinibacteria bacterium Gr01-1014_25]|nr:MAG: Uncharacterized protein G01um101425_726 [Candidatus Peregrinibacteria bacterium Gr01-1014_25]
MRKFPLAFAVGSSLLLTGCLGDVMSIFCEVGEDSDHCYQAVAVQEEQPEDCSKIEFGPPRDKCHLMIAENTGDPTACDGMEGGMMGYSKEECLAGVWKNHMPDDCAGRDNELDCRNAYAKHGKGCGEGYMRSKSTGDCAKVPTKEECEGAQKLNPFCEGTDDDIEDKAANDLNTMKDAATGKYMELLTQAIDDEKDPGKLAGLQAYKEFLEKSGETLESVTATVDTLKELKKIFLDAYDPSMDIEHMPVDKILAPGLVDKISGALFGQDPPDNRSRAEDGLSVYEAMLKRQGDIDYLKKEKLGRLGDAISSTLKDKATGQLQEAAEGIAEGIAGTAFATVGIVDHALTSFKEAAQKEMFVGLAAAYNRRRDAIEQSSPGLSPEEIHARTVAQVKDDPYQDNPNSGFVKYGNLLENQDCQDSSNPLCIDNRVFWTAMDKTYRHTKGK